MATRSTIAVEQEDGTVKAVYCHFDGYLEGVGAKLKAYYNTLERANALVALGSISCLREKLEGTENHTFDTPEENVTIAYHRDRGEKLTHYNSRSISHWTNSGNFEEYNYIFQNGVWNLCEKEITIKPF